MNLNWFPGHMKKTKDLLISNLKLVDIVFELLDARIPYSSKNPEIDKIIKNKPRIVILNKSDLSSIEGNSKWSNYYKQMNIPMVLVNSLNKKGINDVMEHSNKLMQPKIEKLKKRGLKNKTIRAMIVGIPNVGKSTLINALVGRKSTKTGNRPGVTKGKQWIKIRGNINLLDTPGILWPKFEDKNVALNLAFTGAIKDEIIDIETLGLKLVEQIIHISPQLLEERYRIEIDNKTPLEVFNDIAVSRGCIISSNEIDYTRTARMLLDEFRRGIIGKIALEYPQD